MPLPDMLEQLFARRRFGIRPGLERVQLLLDRLGNPERSFRSIHVVGTNGKGSTSAFLASILQAGGHRTALFTSPHLITFSERFRINGQEPDDDRLAETLASVLSCAPHEATFFEIVTALGALLFAREGVEVAVMEAGMGGRSDATAALPGALTVVTPVSLDHSDFLGATLEQIGAEKAGILKQGTPMVLAHQPPGVREVMLEACRRNSSTCLEADRDFSAGWSAAGRLDYQGLRLTLTGLEPGIGGRYQSENAALALAAAETLDSLGLGLPAEALIGGLAAARWPGRMELLPGSPALLLDGAHNPAGAVALARSLADFDYTRLLVVLGIMADKDASAILEPLASLGATCFCVTPAIERAMDDTRLASLAQEAGLSTHACGSVAAGLTAARSSANADDLIVVCGSLFTVGEARAVLTGATFQGIRG